METINRVITEQEDNIAGKPTVHMTHSSKIGGTTIGGLDLDYAGKDTIKDVVKHAGLSEGEVTLFEGLSHLSREGLTSQEINDSNKAFKTTPEMNSLAQKIRNGLVTSKINKLFSRKGKFGNPDSNPVLEELTTEQWGALAGMAIKSDEVLYSMFDKRITDYSSFRELLIEAKDRHVGKENKDGTVSNNEVSKKNYGAYISKYFPVKKKKETKSVKGLMSKIDKEGY